MNTVGSWPITSDGTGDRTGLGGYPGSTPVGDRRSWRLYGPRFLAHHHLLGRDGVKTLVAQGRFVAEGRVAPLRVVPAFDVIEQGPAGVGRRPEPLAVEQLTFQRREETLAQGIVIRIADGAHRWSDTIGQAPLAVGDGGVLTAVIRMMDDV